MRIPNDQQNQSHPSFLNTVICKKLNKKLIVTNHCLFAYFHSIIFTFREFIFRESDAFLLEEDGARFFRVYDKIVGQSATRHFQATFSTVTQQIRN